MKSLIVVSDTHLGLTAGERLRFFKNTVTHRPEILQQFLEWLRDLEEKGETKVLAGIAPGKVEQRRLVAPYEFVLNGDILELWDASDRTYEISTRSIFNALFALSCEKIYLIGNHDFAMDEVTHPLPEEVARRYPKEVAGRYPFGKSSVRIMRDVYPEPRPNEMNTLKLGENHYLFLHGHQLSWIFRNSPWQIVSYLRDGAESLGLFSWILVLLWLINTSILALLWLNTPGIAILFPWVAGAAIVLTALALPRILVSVARPLWNSFRSHRYKRERAFRGFLDWWRSVGPFLDQKGQPVGKVHIVYGHTHLMDLISKDDLQNLLNETIVGSDLVLINHPAWVKDLSKDYEDVLQAAFVYIDAEGYEFFGWDWVSRRPFHIPKEVIPLRAEGKKLDPQTAAWLKNLGWPEKLVEEWKKPLVPKK